MWNLYILCENYMYYVDQNEWFLNIIALLFRYKIIAEIYQVKYIFTLFIEKIRLCPTLHRDLVPLISSPTNIFWQLVQVS